MAGSTVLLTDVCDSRRVISDLRELQGLTSNVRGAQRVAWTETWAKARELYAAKLRGLGLEPQVDEAGNMWSYLPGRCDGYLLVGSHLDSVPDGGWLDGALGVMAGLEVMRQAQDRELALGLALVDFADEEGSRFGHSLFGSSAVSGSLDPARVEGLRDGDGRALPLVIANLGLDLARVPDASARLAGIMGYLELHIEQGALLEEAGVSAGIVRGVLGIERSRITIRGQAGHAGATPMRLRRDALMAFAEGAARLESTATHYGGLATIGEFSLEPGIVTAVPGSITFSCDVRHEDRESLRCLARAVETSFASAASRRNCIVTAARLWRTDPTTFSEGLIGEAARASRDVIGMSFELVSGPGHDAVEMARKVPSAMVFAPSINGLSHVAEEDTDEPSLERAVAVFVLTCVRMLENPDVLTKDRR